MKTKEIFKDIEGFEGLYEVSNLGQVRSLDRIVLTSDNKLKPIKGRILKQNDNGQGYKLVNLYGEFGRRRESVHILVVEAFLGHIKGDWEAICDHINNNPSDNRLENLRIISQRENVLRKRGDFTSTFAGVYKKKNGKYVAQITIEGKKHYLGTFKQEINAAIAYSEVLEDLEGYLKQYQAKRGARLSKQKDNALK